MSLFYHVQIILDGFTAGKKGERMLRSTRLRDDARLMRGHPRVTSTVCQCVAIWWSNDEHKIEQTCVEEN